MALAARAKEDIRLIIRLPETSTLPCLFRAHPSCRGYRVLAAAGPRREGRPWQRQLTGSEARLPQRQRVERRGSFRGIAHDGAAKGLLFPASLVFSRGSIYVTNLALPLTEAQGDEPEEDVTTYTVARIPID